jgi:uncharacterized protein (TIGR02687 family)
MTKNQIADALNKLFLEDGKRIVFWEDADGAFVDDFDELELEGVAKWRLDEHGPLATKIELERNRPHDRFLLYAPFPRPDLHDDWLLDIRLYAAGFSADRPSLILNTLGLTTISLVGYLNEHLDFFNAQSRLQQIAKFVTPSDRRDDLDLKILTVLSKATYARVEAIALALFTGFESASSGAGPLFTDDTGFQQANPLWDEVCKFGMDEAFWRFAGQHWGYQAKKPSLQDLFIHLTVTHFHQDFQPVQGGEFPKSLERFVLAKAPEGKSKDTAKSEAEPWRVNASVFVSNWMQNTKHAKLYERLANGVESELGIRKLVADCGAAQLLRADTFEALEQQIIIDTLQSILAGGDITYALAQGTINQRLDRYWCMAGDRSYARIYDAMSASLVLFRLQRKYQDGFSFDSAAAMFQAYTKELFQFDQAYRGVYTAAMGVKHGIDILKKHLLPAVENCYRNSYLPNLAIAWGKHMEEELLAKWQIEGVPRQTEFYRRYVMSILNERDTSRAYVIVSDALRYEVAEEISRLMNREDRIASEPVAMLGVLPSCTKMGMAALLPHDSFEIGDKGEAILDGVATTSANREEILQKAEPASKVIKADDLLEMTTKEGRDFVKDTRVVYIYHDRIDAIGDKQATEEKTFEAVAQSVDELKRLIEYIHGCLNGNRILLTADHGFVFQMGDLEVTDKSPWDSSGCVMESKKRYVIGSDLPEQANTWKIPLKAILGNESKGEVVVPKGFQRFHFTGGAKFVHGGALLPEIVVPVLKLTGLKGKAAEQGKAQKVDVQILDTNRKVSNNRQRFSFIQTAKVEGKTLPRTLRIGFYSKDGRLISDEPVLTFDSASDQMQDRQKNAMITVKAGSYTKTDDYYLVMTDDETGAEYRKIPYQISLGIMDDFGKW